MEQTACDKNDKGDLQFVREPKVLSMFPVSRSQLWRLIKEGRFPKPCKISERVSVWDMRALIEHAQTLKAKKSGNDEQS